ncbi:cupin domain-containing protein [bacterium]|nr:cupin domain-containing protein [bacterium]
MLTAEAIIRELNLQSHPEGGSFRETYRSSVEAKTTNVRSVCTAIYFLLREGQRSEWHRVKHDEIYHFYYGAPLELMMISPRGEFTRSIFGVNLENGERPQIIIPGNFWQSARSLGAFTLYGCTVSPGFDFQDFEMSDAIQLKKIFPGLSEQLG